MKLRITQNDKGFYVEEDVGKKKFLRAYIPDWQLCQIMHMWDVQTLQHYSNILHYEVTAQKARHDTKEKAIEYAKCLWFALSTKGKVYSEAQLKKAEARTVVAELEFYFDPETGNLEAREI